jgi:CheY-like chemotaxis protein
MSELGDLLQGLAAALWVFLALFVFLVLRKGIKERAPFLTKLGLGPTGVSMEFAEAKLDEATRRGPGGPGNRIGEAAKRTVIIRLERNAELIARSRILWVDDHPENNTPVVDLLKRVGAAVDLSTTNADAIELLGTSPYDVIVTDVGREDEGENSELKGLDLATAVFERWGQKVILFTGRFDPTRVPNMDESGRLQIARKVDDYVFGRANRFDEVLHLILDQVERTRS